MSSIADQRVRGIVSNSSRIKRLSVCLVLWAFSARAVPAQRLATLHSFNGTDGAQPISPFVQATDGNLYGTTYSGGGYGTAFKITLDGGFTALHSFGSGGKDGAYPLSGLIQANNGDLYGTTATGGIGEAGTVFQISLAGALTSAPFFVTPYDQPDGVVQGIDGSLYGTTGFGGQYNAGTFFRITPAATLTTLYNFTGGADGFFPQVGLILATDGNFYGTTFYGGSFLEIGAGSGTVYKITPGGILTTLYTFCKQVTCPDGSNPGSGLIQAGDGNLYGTTIYGGGGLSSSVGSGTIYRITPNGKLTTLHSFCLQIGELGCIDGQSPSAPLLQASDGKLFGVVGSGGQYGYGYIFGLTATGNLTSVYSFCSHGSPCPDGSNPSAGLTQARNGILYGTANHGGAYNFGTVFRLSVGLGPFVETKPTWGVAGTIIEVLGSNLTGATLVTFNGRPAPFKVASSSEIITKVPTGATSGLVQVFSPSGSLSSNIPFIVR